MSEYEFGFAAIEHEKIDDVLAMLEKYKINKYIVALEKVSNGSHATTNGEHLHFVLQVEPKQFKNFRETLKNTYQLTGKNGKTGRYCGWVKKPRDPERFIAYSVKDKNIRSKGFEEGELKKYFEASFTKKETDIDILMDQLVKKRVENINIDHQCDTTRIEVYILSYHMDLGKRICKSQIKNLTLTYLQLYMPNRNDYKDLIYHYTMNH